MKWLIRKCVKCGTYTLNVKCPRCSGETSIPHPAKFSIDDKYARYRQMRKEEKNGNSYSGGKNKT